jgi:SAM-dependent methyltransferase
MHSNDKEKQFLAGGERTLNYTGYMTGNLDPFSLDFIEYAATSSGKVLDIGACYGIATLSALSKGAKVVATDNEPRHLEILRSRTPAQDLERLECVIGALPDALHFSPDSFSAILCCRVLHLLRDNEIDLALQHMHDWLEEGGRLYLINDTPYTRYSDKMLAEFPAIHDERKRAGANWPGHISNIKYYLDPGFHGLCPEFVTLMDIDAIVAACKRCGFAILQASYIPRPDYPAALQNDGRENVGVIAVKKAKG